MDDVLAQFTSITSAEPERAQQYLTLTEGNFEQAIQLYFESDGVDMGGSIGGGAQQTSSRPHEVMNLDSDDDDEEATSTSAARQRGPTRSMEDDEAIARRMQEEMYGAGGGPGNDMAGVRAPVARTAETLMGPDSDWRDDPDEMHAAVLEQLRSRAAPAGRPGIFNQAPLSGSIWENGIEDPEIRRRNLSRATAGASDASSKTSLLAEMYRPPFEIMSKLATWDGVRAEGKEEEKWILVNVQDPNIFDCQVLNRDIWKNPQIQETIKENFIFKQYNKDDPQANNYVRFYFQAYESPDAYPHIAIVDPRTGEQVKVWSGMPMPKAMDFLMQLHEFLDRYSLKANSRNPVATRKAEKRRETDVDRMTEEEMLEMALQNSLAGRAQGPRESDPDILTRQTDTPSSVTGNGASDSSGGTVHELDPSAQAPQVSDPLPENIEPSPFSSISSSKPHSEPSADPVRTTRIQFRHPGGRVVRRCNVTDSVRRLYEWLKSEPLEGKAGVPFELIFMGRNLIDSLDQTVEGAGLKNGSIMVEFIEG